LQRGINAHGKTGQDRHCDGESEHRKRQLNARSGIEREKIRGHLGDEWYELPRQECAG
jgi:hypothetical protein